MMLKERSQTQKVTLHMIPLYEMSGISKPRETESRSLVARGWGMAGEEQGGTANACGVSFRGDESILELDKW